MSPGWTWSTPKPAVTADDLPDEILLEIFSYLPLEDLARSALVCERWHALSKGLKELWRRKEWRSGNVVATQRFMEYGAGIPQLRSLRLLYDDEYAIRVSWPTATVHLYLGTPHRWEPYFRHFDTESLVVSSLLVEQISGYVQCTNMRTLRRICVSDQDYGFISSRIGPYFNFVPTGPHYMCPVRRHKCPELKHSEERCYPLGDPGEGGESEGAEGGAGGDAPCPALEVLNVHSQRVSDQRLAELCALGPLRTVRIESRGVRDLLALRGVYGHLRELSVSDCGGMAPWDFYELRGMLKLRTLRLGRCRLDEAELRRLTAGLPDLRSLTVNGHELLGEV